MRNARRMFRTIAIAVRGMSEWRSQERCAAFVGSDRRCAGFDRRRERRPDARRGCRALQLRRNGGPQRATVGGRVSADNRAGGPLRSTGGHSWHADRHPRFRHRPERRERADPGLRGALPDANGRDPRRRSPEPDAPRATRGHHPAHRRRGRAPRTVLSSGPRFTSHQHDWRQRRGELRRASRPQVRRHARLCDGPRGRAGRRPDRAARQRLCQGRRGLLAEGSVHRL